MKVAVTSRSFSNNKFLRDYLQKFYKDCYFNETNKPFKKNDLINFLKDADAAIVGLEQIDEYILTKLPKLKIISKYGVGLNNLDLKEIKKRNISLGYSEGVNKNSVAELTLSAAILLRHNALKALSLVKDNIWKQVIGKELMGSTFGIIGYGNVGSRLSNLLKPFNCKILYYDTNKKIISNSINIKKVPLYYLIKKSDIISLHIPLNKKNINFYSKDKIKLMRSNSIFLNFSRGGLVDEKFLFQRYKKGMISGLGFDVLKNEPKIELDIRNENIFLSPHIGGSSEESIKNMGISSVKNLKKTKTLTSKFINYYSIS